MAMFACFSPLSLVGKKTKKQPKGFSKAVERSKKIGNRRRRRVTKSAADFVSTSSDLEIMETISRSFPAVDKPSSTILKAPSMEDDEQQFEIESLKGDCSGKPEGELVFHDGSSDDFNGRVSEKLTATDNGIAREATTASNSDNEGETIVLESDQNQCVPLSSGRPSMDRINAEEEMEQACSIIQCLNSFSTEAYISSIGLKLIPPMAAFVCLRSVDLSGNCIVDITPGSLPKSLHTLDLSRNKISTVEGLRGLERLRILNLSYNRISRIGHGLSSCILIKELYLAGNRISDAEGLHRILKLKVLDMSFNKITTAKGLGQLVANYNSLLALNLTGNPVQANIGSDQLQKEVQGLLPHLSYLNKLPIKPLKIREVATKCVAKAAVGDATRRSPQRKMTRRLSGIGSSASSITNPGGNLREASSKATPFRAIKRRSKSELSTPARVNYSRRSHSMVPAV